MEEEKMLHVSKVSEKFIRKLAEEYITPYATLEGVAKQHKSSASTISNILFRGVVEDIISDIIAEEIVTKMSAWTENQARTKRRWDRALKLREANRLDMEYEFMNKKLEELKFQYETYDSYCFDDEGHISKDDLARQVIHLEEDILSLGRYIKKLRSN